MSDQPQIDNPQDVGLGIPTEKNPKPFSPDLKKPGPATGSTALDLNKIKIEQQTGNEDLIKALMQGIKEEEIFSPKVNEKQPEENIAKRNINKQQGFLTSFMNGFNNAIEGIWNALKSLIPMKPQTGIQ